MIKVVFWTRASHEWGYGHIYRCLRLAKLLLDRYDVTLITNENEDCAQMVSENSIKYSSCNMTMLPQLLKKMGANLLIIDQPVWNESAYIQKLKENVDAIISFDDKGSGAVYADVLINAIIGLPEDRPLKSYEGINYLVFDDNIETYARKESYDGDEDFILLSFGGTDPNNISELIIPVIQKMPHINFVLVLGLGYRDYPKFVEKYSYINNLRIIFNASNMAELIYKARICVVSGGLTLYECIYLHKTVAVLCQIPQQSITANNLRKFGNIVNFGVVDSENSDGIEKILEFLMNPLKDENVSYWHIINGKYRILNIINEICEGIVCKN